MNNIETITEKVLLKKVEDGVSKNKIWQKPLLLLTKDGDDYNYMLDALKETYKSQNINTDPSSFEFVRIGDKLEMSFNGEKVNGHHTDVDVYYYLGGCKGYDEKTHRYCVDLVEYEAKPVISFICVTDKDCSIENIPDWMQEKFEIAMLQLDFSSYGEK